MADQKITELPIKTSAGINLTDYLLGIDSAEGYQMLVSDIAKKIVEDYAGSTLLGTAQSVASALENLKGATALINSNYYTQIPNDSDLDTYVTPGVYGVASNAAAKSLSNCPVESSFKMIVEDRTTIRSDTGNYRYKWQTLYHFNSTDIYRRRLSSSDGGVTWTIVPQEWEKQPTRTEMDGTYSLIEGNRIGVDVDWDTLTTYGTFFVNAVPTGNNKPVASTGKLIVERSVYNNTNIKQTFYSADPSVGVCFVRFRTTSSAWSAWEKQPTRAEMDAVSTIKTATITPSTGFESAGFSTFSITQCGRLVVINGYISNLTGLSTSASTEIASFSNVSLPTAAVRVNAIYSAQAYEPGKNAYISFGNNGKIQVRLGEEVTNGKVLYLSASYLV